MMIGVRHRAVIFLLAAAVTLTAGEIRNKGWWQHTVFYQIYPRSFMDSNADGVGDLKGITSKLEHFVNSGIGAIWLSPINRSPMVDFGYDISDFQDVDEAFGNIEDFSALITRAKELGIKVILDLVPNHTSDEHFWFQQSIKKVGKYTDYYVWADGKADSKPPNNWISVFSGPAWTYHPTRKQWYFHQFDKRQPDLNYKNPDVQEAMRQVIVYWLEKGVDGFRIDAVPHIFEEDISKDEPLSNDPNATDRDYTYLQHIYTKDHPLTYELIQSWRNIMDDFADRNNLDEKVIMTEAYTSLENTTKYYNYGSHVPFNFKFIVDVSHTSPITAFKKVIDDWMAAMPANGVANWVMGNHDRSRVASRYPGRADQATMLAMILPGVAVTYNGEEIAMEDKTDISWADTQDPQACNAGKDKYATRSRDINRTPFQWDDSKNAGFSNATKTWLPVHDNYKEVNLAKQMQDEESHYKIYTALTNLRKTSYALRQGDLRTRISQNERVLIIIRDGGNETVTLLINFSDTEQQTINLSGDLRGSAVVRVASLNSGVKAGTEVDITSIVLPAKASIVIYSSGAMGIFVSFSPILTVLAVLLFQH